MKLDLSQLPRFTFEVLRFYPNGRLYRVRRVSPKDISQISYPEGPVQEIISIKLGDHQLSEEEIRNLQTAPETTLPEALIPPGCRFTGSHFIGIMSGPSGFRATEPIDA